MRSREADVVKFARRRLNKPSTASAAPRAGARWVGPALLVAGIAVVGWYSGLFSNPVPAIASFVTPGCVIKGNVSINTGERIYHVPGQFRYAETRISPQYGERWFCSEAEARAAGWRKARS